MNWKYILFLSTLHIVTNRINGDHPKLIDMTYSINNDTIYYPLFFRHELVKMFDGPVDMGKGMDPARAMFHYYRIAEHYSTHIDAPIHFSSDPYAWTVDQIPVERLIGEAVVIDIAERAAQDPDTQVLVDDLIQWEEYHHRIEDGSIVLLYSGWDRRWGNEATYLGNDVKNMSAFHYPGFSQDAAQWLVNNRMIYGVGVDTISLDCGSCPYNYAHNVFLSNKIYGLENVKNIGMLPKSGAKLYVFPIKMEGGSGGQVRIIADVSTYDKPPIWSSASIYNIHVTSLFAMFFLQII